MIVFSRRWHEKTQLEYLIFNYDVDIKRRSVSASIDDAFKGLFFYNKFFKIYVIINTYNDNV